MKTLSKPKFVITLIFSLVALLAAAVFTGGCGESDQPAAQKPPRTSTTIQTMPTITSVMPNRPGIRLDPDLKSSTGIPADDEMKPLIALQAQVPYPVMVPTSLPGNYTLDTDLIGSSSATPRDPAGYYSFRYSDPNNGSRTLTFNQSQGNARELSGYYLTEATIEGTDYQVYWHRTLEYLPNGEPVRTTSVVNAETYVVVWHQTYTGAQGQPLDLYYSLVTGTWTGLTWGDIKSILKGTKPLGSVGQ